MLMTQTDQTPPCPATMSDEEDAAQSRIAAALAQAAATEEAGTTDIAVSLARLRAAGWLEDDGLADPDLTARRLRRVGAANLSVGRLWEGHINALYLARVHASAEAGQQMLSLFNDGAIFGVWGADGNVPVQVASQGDTLIGSKVFASGLGTVTHAVITVDSGPQVRLGLVDVRDADRADASGWRMTGMQATASGRYDFDGIAAGDVLWLGGPGDYVKEPHFIGGVWRIAALQIGAATGLLDAAAGVLRDRNRLDAPAQLARFSAVAIKALAASALTSRAACAAASGDHAPELAATLSAAARLATEEVALDAIRCVEQSLGLAHFGSGTDTERKSRDLSVYLRQAARDAFQQRVGTACFAQEATLWSVF